MKAFEKAVWLGAVLFLGLLLGALIMLDPFDPALHRHISASIQNSALSHPVTAVLLDFRSLDTLLEAGVIVLAAAACLVLWPMFFYKPAAFKASVIATYGAFVFPLIAVVATYLLYSGAYQSGGAFQAAALFGGGLILAHLNGSLHLGAIPAVFIRALYSLGLFVFIAVGFLGAAEGSFLQYPQEGRYYLILGIETSLALSLSALLAAFFIQAVERIGR